VFLVSIKQLIGLGLSISKLWTLFVVNSAVARCEITINQCPTYVYNHWATTYHV